MANPRKKGDKQPLLNKSDESSEKILTNEDELPSKKAKCENKSNFSYKLFAKAKDKRSLRGRKAQPSVRDKEGNIWDEKIHFGVGSPAKDGKPGFKVNEQNIGAFTGLLFRGDSRPPRKIFNIGFTPNPSKKLVAGRYPSRTPGVCPHSGTTRGGVSTSSSATIAAAWAAANAQEGKPGYVYAIYLKDEPLVASIKSNAGDLALLKASAKLQKEYLALSVSPSCIYAVRKVVKGKLGMPNYEDDVQFNSNFSGEEPKLPTANSPERFFNNKKNGILSPSPGINPSRAR